MSDTRKLHIAPNVTLPIDAALARFVVLGKSGAGKSNANVVMAEELVRCGIPTWLLDPLGNLWGLRSSLDGQHAGLPIVIFGGAHADAPLHAGDGRRIARLVAGEKISALLDLSELDLEEQRVFAEEFCTELLAIAKKANLIGHLFLDEADRFAPNTLGIKKSAAVKRFARIARNFSLGWTFSSQRVQLLNPEVVESANVVVAMKMPTGLAKDKLGGKIAGAFDTAAAMRAMLDSLPGLKKGEAWFVPDSDWLHGEQDAAPFRFRFRWRETFDSTEVRRIGVDVVEPKVLADIDLAKIREALEIPDESEDAGVDELRAEIRTLRDVIEDSDRLVREADVILNGENAARQASLCDIVAQLAQRRAQTVEVPVISEADFQKVEEAVGNCERLVERFNQDLQPMVEKVGEFGRELLAKIDVVLEAEADRNRVRNLRRNEAESFHLSTRPVQESTRKSVPVRTSSNGKTSSLAKAERLILTVLAQFPTRTPVQIAILAGYSVNGGGFRNALGALNSKGYLARDAGVLAITQSGANALGHFDPLPTGRALLNHWLTQLSKAEASALRVIADAYPRRISVGAVAREAGYEPLGGGFRNALGRLRTLELVEGRGDLRASDALFDRAPTPQRT